MIATLGPALALLLASTGPGQAPAPAAPEQAPGPRFEALLKAAREKPETADWAEVRRAFARTAQFKPYDVEVPKKLEAVADAVKRGEVEGAEAELVRLVERERFMRVESMAMLMAFYEGTGEPEKAKPYRDLVAAIVRSMARPDAAKGFDTSVEVLFIQEEYYFAKGEVTRQRTVVRDGRHYDVLTVAADGDRPGRELYFNVDLPWAANAIAPAR